MSQVQVGVDRTLPETGRRDQDEKTESNPVVASVKRLQHRCCPVLVCAVHHHGGAFKADRLPSSCADVGAATTIDELGAASGKHTQA